MANTDRITLKPPLSHAQARSLLNEAVEELHPLRSIAQVLQDKICDMSEDRPANAYEKDVILGLSNALEQGFGRLIERLDYGFDMMQWEGLAKQAARRKVKP